MNIQNTPLQLEQGKESLTDFDVMQMLAAKYGALTVIEAKNARPYDRWMIPLKSYAINSERLAFLSSRGIIRPPESFRREGFDQYVDRGLIFGDGSHTVDIHEYWLFELPFDPAGQNWRIDTLLHTFVDVWGQRIHCSCGTAGQRGSPLSLFSNKSPAEAHISMFEALVDSDPECQSGIAREISDSELGIIDVSFHQIGLINALPLKDLFEKTFGVKRFSVGCGNPTPKDVAYYNLVRELALFDPDPEEQMSLIITKQAQAKVATAWKDQLKTHLKEYNEFFALAEV